MMKSMGAEKPEVFFAPREDLESFDKLFASLRLPELFPAGGRIAVKLHMGETYSKYIVKPVFVARAVELLQQRGFVPFVTDTTAIYPGGRENEKLYLKTAAGNGFTSGKMHGAKIVIADGDGEKEVLHLLKKFLSLNQIRIAWEIANCDGMLLLTHFKGHPQAGVGGAIKNVGMGCVSKKGKEEIHNVASPKFDIEKCTGCGACVEVCPFTKKALRIDESKKIVVFDERRCVSCGSCYRVCKNDVISFDNGGGQDPSITLQNRLADATRAVHERLSGRIAGINFIRDITKYCDCCKPSKIIAPDVGMMASRDLVALDQASCDSVKSAAGRDIFLEETTVEGEVQMSSAQALGVGRRDYELKKI